MATAPDSAVTVTVKVLLPVTKPARPATSTTERTSLATAATVTEVVPLATVTTSPLATVEPLTVNVANELSVERGVTLKVTVKV